MGASLWVQGTEPGLAGRATRALNFWVISPFLLDLFRTDVKKDSSNTICKYHICSLLSHHVHVHACMCLCVFHSLYVSPSGFFFFWERLFLSRHGWLGTYYVAQAALTLASTLLPLPCAAIVGKSQHVWFMSYPYETQKEWYSRRIRLRVF